MNEKDRVVKISSEDYEFFHDMKFELRKDSLKEVSSAVVRFCKTHKEQLKEFSLQADSLVISNKGGA